MIGGFSIGTGYIGGPAGNPPITVPMSLTAGIGGSAGHMRRVGRTFTAISLIAPAVNRAIYMLVISISIISGSIHTSKCLLAALFADITTDLRLLRRLSAMRSLSVDMTTGAVNIFGRLNQLGLTAALTLAATSVQGAGRILAASINSIGSLMLFRHKLMLALLTPTAVITRWLQLGLFCATRPEAYAGVTLQAQRTIGLTITSTARTIREFSRAITSSIKATGKLLFGKPILLLAAIGTTALVDTAFVFTAIITATVALIPYFTRVLRTILFVTQTAFTAIGRAMAFRLVAGVLGRYFQSRVTGMTRIATLQASPALNRIHTFVVSIASGILVLPAINHIKNYLRRLSAMQLTSPDLLRTIGKNLMARLRGTSGVIKALTKALFAGMEAIANVKRTLRLLMSLASGLSTVANSATVQLFKRALSAIQTSVPNQIRAVGKNLISRVRGAGSFIRNHLRIVSANISVSGSLSRIVSRYFSMFSGVIAISGLKNVRKYVRQFVTDTQTKADYSFQLGKQLRVRLNLRIALMRHWPMRLITSATINCLMTTVLLTRCVADAARRVIAPLLRQAYKPERKRPLVPGKGRTPKA